MKPHSDNRKDIHYYQVPELFHQRTWGKQNRSILLVLVVYSNLLYQADDRPLDQPQDVLHSFRMFDTHRLSQFQ